MRARPSGTEDWSSVERVLREVKAWLHETFPERQIYIRSDGRIQFFTFGPLLQAVLASATVLFLGWVAFASVNVIFKDRIISSKEKHFQQMQAAYESRVADLQLSYDEVNSALVASNDRFHQVAGQLEAKQNTILNFLDGKRRSDSALAAMGKTHIKMTTPQHPSAAAQDGAPDKPAKRTAFGRQSSAAPAAAPRTMRHAGLMHFGGTMGRIASAFFGERRTRPTSAATLARYPVLKDLAAETTRVAQIGADETRLMAQAEGEAGKGVTQIRALLRRTGINPDQFESRLAARYGVGGPDIPLDATADIGVTDPAFQHAYLHASATLDKLNQLLAGMGHVPLTVPVWGNEFVFTSGYGPRLDPFTGGYAFHPGIDFGGPMGAIVRATAPGVVVDTEHNPSYGNLVEIDHGYGLHTRYGHLSAILVKRGDKVHKGAQIGRLGSTGRSTGPHVHYEVWYNGKLRNPQNFIEAGRYVLKQG